MIRRRPATEAASGAPPVTIRPLRTGADGSGDGGALLGPGGATEDLDAACDLTDAALAGRLQSRLGATHDVLACPGFGAWQGEDLVGLATWTAQRPRAELAALCVRADCRGHGIGGALLEWVAAAGRKHGTHELWLVTTNDNLDALVLYQRHAFRLVELRPGAVDEARRRRPGIPATGSYGIALRDELILERRL